MTKRLLVGLLALSVFVIWATPEADARVIGGSRSQNGVLNNFFATEISLHGVAIVDKEFGLGDECRITGTLYCASTGSGESIVQVMSASTSIAELACKVGKTASRAILIDLTSIPTRLFTPGPGSLEQLPRFEERVFSEDSADRLVTLYTGTNRNAAWYDLNRTPDICPGYDISLGDYSNTLFAGEESQTESESGNDVKLTPLLKQDLLDLVVRGERILGLVYNRDIRTSRDGIPWHILPGGNVVGTVAFNVVGLECGWWGCKMTVELVNADWARCGDGQILYTAEDEIQECANIAVQAEVPVGGPDSEIDFIKASGVFDCPTGNCRESFESLLPEEEGNSLCQHFFEEDSVFVDFIPADGPTGWAFVVNTDFSRDGNDVNFDNETEDRTERCRERAGSLEYDCEIIGTELPTCDGTQLNNFPCNIKNWETFLKGQCDKAKFNLPPTDLYLATEDSSASDYCLPVDGDFLLTGKFNAYAIATEAGHNIHVIRTSDSAVISSKKFSFFWGLPEMVDFDDGDLIFEDKDGVDHKKSLNDISLANRDFFKICSLQAATDPFVYLSEERYDQSVPVRYDPNPLVLPEGALMVFFDDAGNDPDFDDLIMALVPAE